MTSRVPLKKAVKDLLAAKTLTEQELGELERLQRRADKARRTPAFSWFSAMLGSVAAGIIISVISFSLLKQPSADIQQRIAHEVLTNHLKIKPLDVETNSIVQVKTYFDRLDFAPQLSKHISNESATLLGGRYCTLQGAIAAQLRFKLPSGEVITFYQAAYDPKRFGKIPDAEHSEPALQFKERGFQMRMWKESNLVMVTAQLDS